MRKRARPEQDVAIVGEAGETRRAFSAAQWSTGDLSGVADPEQTSGRCEIGGRRGGAEVTDAT